MDESGVGAGSRWLRPKRLAIIAALLIAGVAGGIFVARWSSESGPPAPSLPSDITVPFGAYLPLELPGNYQVDESSFSAQNNVLVYTAKDSTGATIVFTEQPKPKDFDFTAFHSSLAESKTLSDVPYASVTGKNGNGRILSVLADDTWILATTQSALSEDDVAKIARAMKLARQ